MLRPILGLVTVDWIGFHYDLLRCGKKSLEYC